MQEENTARDRSTSRFLLACGIAAGPVYIALGLGQALARDGFDVRRHAISHLSNGDLGWIQIANFLLSGALVIAGAVGVRRLLHPGRGGTWGPILLGGYGLGLIGAGVFVADPVPGFPPGTPQAMEMSRDGLLHLLFGAVGFYSVIAACFVFTRRFAGFGRSRWAAYSAFTGIAFFLAFAALSSGFASSTIMLTFYAAVAWVWVWHAALSARLLRELDAGASRAAPASATGLSSG